MWNPSKCGRIRLDVVAAAVGLLALAGSPVAADGLREEMHERLGFLVGNWTTSHSLPSGAGELVTVRGEAVIEWAVGGSWLRHEFHTEIPGRGEVFETHLMNFSPSREEYSFYLFDHFGGEAGIFHGGWIDEEEIVVTAEFAEEDGSTSYQKYTLTPVSENEIWISRAFSDDGVDYHFEVRGVYTRGGDPESSG